MNYNNWGPFEANVWGTVSDWAAVIVYGVTGILIWRTLKAQIKSTKIDEATHKLAIMPFFDVKILPTTALNIEKTNFMLSLDLEIKLINENTASQFMIFLPKDSIWIDTIERPIRVTNFKPSVTYNLNLIQTSNLIEIENELCELAVLEFNIEFIDYLKNIYQQKIHYHRIKGSQMISTSYPELIN